MAAPSHSILLFVLLITGCLAGCEGCLKRAPIDAVDVHPYPTCDGREIPESGEVLVDRVLRPGPTTAGDRTVVEHYRIERRDCVYVATVHQEWIRQTSDVEVVFDAEWRPLRAWKRMTIPGVPPDGRPDTRLYELRNDPVTLTMVDHEGVRQHRFFRAEAPIAVLGPGRGLVSAWIQAQGEMEVGDVVRGPVLDFRELLEAVEEVALVRQPDRYDETLGQTVRVYTVYGREAVFTDEDGWVVGDLAGLRPSDALDTPMPAALPTYDPPNPRVNP